MRVLQNAPGPVESVQERCPAAGAPPAIEPLLRREGVGPLGQMLGTEQLATDGPGQEVLAGVGTAGNETESQSGRLERSDGADPLVVVGAVYDGS